MRLRSLTIFLFSLCCFTQSFAQAPSGAWWNGYFEHRQQIAIPAGGAALPSGYAVSLTFNHAALVAAGRSLAGGDDIRIARWNSAGQNWVELDRVLDPQSAWNTGATTIWFRTSATINAGVTSQDYYLYYGDAFAGAPPQDPEAVFTLYDAFTATTLTASRWSSTGAPTIAAGVLTLPVNATLRSSAAYPLGVNTIWEARIQMPDSLPNGGDRHFYYWTANNGVTFANGDAYAGLYANTTDHYATARNGGPAATNSVIAEGAPTAWQTYSFARIGVDRVEYWVNGASVATTSANAPAGALRIFLWNDANGARTQRYDWVRVRPYRAPEPIVSLAALESFTGVATASYSFEQPSWTGATGEVLDSSGNALHGSAANGAVTANATPAIAGATGTCRYASLDGADDFIRVADASALDMRSEFSMAAWIRHRTNAYRDWEAILAKGDNAYRVHLNGNCFIQGTAAGNTRYGVTLGLNNGCATADLNSNSVPPANVWRHVAATYNGSHMRVYVDGVLVNRANFNATINQNNYELRIGGNAQQSGRYWTGDIDEVTIWNKGVPPAVIAAHRAATHQCTDAPRLVVRHDGYGVHCAPETITVEVRDAANNLYAGYNETIRLDTGSGRGAWTLVSGGGSFSDNDDDGVATYAWPLGQSSATFTLTYRSGAPTIDVDAYQANNTSIRDDDSEGSLTFTQTGFTVTSAALSNPPPAAIAPFASQIAGATFPVHITAYGSTPTDPQCGVIESYTGAKPLKFWFDYLNPTGGSRQVTIDGVSVGTAAGAAQSVSFTNGQAVVNAKYKDVGAIAINVIDDSAPPSAISGGTGAFIVRPDDLVLSDIQRPGPSGMVPNPGAAGASGPVFTAAGARFSVTVTALDAEGDATPNFGRESPPQNVELTPTLLAPLGGQTGSISAPIGFASFSNGAATGVDFSWSEVGVITLTPHLRNANYLGAADVIGAASGAVGRFTPFDFDVSANAPQFETACAAGGFTYVGQPFVYRIAPVMNVTARNASGGTTLNYTGDFMKMTNVSLTNRAYDAGAQPLDATGAPSPDPSISDIGGGQALLTFSAGTGLRFARTTPIAPFTPAISLSLNVSDADGVSYSSNPYVIGAAGGIPFHTGAEQRYGRLAFRNAVGSELLNLPVSLRAEYFMSDLAGFVLNTADVCTNNVSLSLTASAGNLAADETCAADSANESGIGCSAPVALQPSQQPYREPPLAGDFSLILRAPGAGNDGAVTINSVVPDWLMFNWNAAGPAHPSGVAAFGLFPGHSKRIYQRETVR